MVFRVAVTQLLLVRAKRLRFGRIF